MEDNEIQEKIALAEKSVSHMKDEKLRTKAFEVILNNLLSHILSKSEKPNAPNITPQIAKKQPVSELMKSKFEPDKLASALNIDINKLKNIIDLYDSDFHIISDIPGGKSESTKQQNSALIILTIQYYCFNNREILSGDLRKQMSDLGIISLINMSSNLSLMKSFIVKTGLRGSHDTKYRITDPGIRKGLELIKEMLNKSEVNVKSTE